MSTLPIDAHLPALVEALRVRPRLVLRAEPGAGKTTRVPAALVDAGFARAGPIVVLEPRRIAARAAAEWVARARGGTVGGEVGYRVRFDERGGPATRLWFVTEGVFGRQLAADPFLERIGAVVLDEFHERHLTGDVALAAVRHLQATVRPELPLVVMSATLDTDVLARALGDATVVTCEGRAHPVAIEYEPAAESTPLAAGVAGVVRRLLDAPGDVLVFLPGAAEIRRVAAALSPFAAAAGFDVVPLHGELPLDDQGRALRPGPRRRVVLATNVAETALTVEGVTAVVDAGLARVARFDTRHGVNALRVQPISRAAADQRAGRAGRTGPGRCVRLWSRAEHAGRRATETPEVLRLDLARMLLDLRAWGVAGPAELPWLDAPPAGAAARADALLAGLGALDAAGALTPVGRRMMEIPAEPRFARVVVAAEDGGAGADGALLAALLGERDVLARALGGSGADFPPGPSDLLLRMELFADAARRGFASAACRALGLDPGAVRAVERARRQLARRLRSRGRPADEATIRRALLAGFPDRVARRRAPGAARAVMVGGAGIALARESVVRDAELLVALDVERRDGPDALVRLASAIDAAWLAELFPDAVGEHRAIVFDAARGRVVARVERRYRDLVLAERVETAGDRAEAGAVLAEAVRADPALLPAGEEEAALLDRLAFLGRSMPELVLGDVATLFDEARAACCAGHVSVTEAQRAGLGRTIMARLTSAQRAALARDAPADVRLPGGRVAVISYPAARAPTVAARIQELFGLVATPRLAAGRVPLVFELTAPSGRPVQVTDDLASFWRSTYAEVRRELRGRYPKHDWPEVPLAATPRSRPGRRR